MGCVVGASSPSVAACNATCQGATGCSFEFDGTTFDLCGSCPNRWVNPQTLKIEVLPGAEPFWPPGFGISPCDSANTYECQLGCMMAFDPSLAPVLPPDPPPPPALPLPPAPWPTPSSGFNFSEVFSDHVVLQAGPGAASVYGNTGAAGDAASVSVTVTPSTGTPYSVPAAVSGGRWRALLRPTAAFETTGVTYKVAAACASGCGGGAPAVTLTDVVFGDVLFCAGQSNMWLSLIYTYAYNASRAAALNCSYDNIRLMSGDSQSQGLSPAVPPVHPWRLNRAAAALAPDDDDAWAAFSAPCYHAAEALTDAHVAAGRAAPTLGLVAVAIGGSTIEEWMTNDVAEPCAYFQHSANGNGLNHVLWDSIVRSFVNMTIRGWAWYQGENNAGSLHGSYASSSGYACLMPALVAAWRAAWSATPGTTDALAPFVLTTLSADDSEGAADIASFRFAQTGSFGVAPNAAMPNVFVAHAYDLADPWVNCGDAPQTKKCAGCDTADPQFNCLQEYYMGPGIHPRLKKPVGQRIATALLAGVYGFGGPATGPTLAGCTYSTGPTPTLSLAFNTSLLAGADLVVHPYDQGRPALSATSVLVNSTGAAGSGAWVAVNIAAGAPGSGTVAVDLAPLKGAAPQAIKYAWGATGGPTNGGDVVCCASGTAAAECVPGGCPLFVAQPLAPLGGLPANPFLAQITASGKCECPEPQDCSA